MENISRIEIPARDIFYFRQRQKNRVFAQLAAFFADEALRNGVTKRSIAAALRRDPSQITRWLSEPNNLTLDTISDLLLSLGAEMDHRIIKIDDQLQSNLVHPLVASILNDYEENKNNKGLFKAMSQQERPQSSIFTDGVVEAISVKLTLPEVRSKSRASSVEFATYALESA